MTPLVVVLAAGGILGVAAPLVLGRLERLDRAPQTAAYLWIMATVGALSAVVLAGLLLLVGSSRLLGDLAVLLSTCTMALRAALDAPTGTPGPLLGLALFALVAGGLLGGGLIAGTHAWRAARGQRELLTLAGRTQPGLPGVTVLDHPVPLAYCLPGRVGRRRGPVVITTATLEQLEPAQLQAVLAHERAHQARRHHALLLVAQALGIGFPWLPAARAAHTPWPAWSSWPPTTPPSTATRRPTSPSRSPSSPLPPRRLWGLVPAARPPSSASAGSPPHPAAAPVERCGLPACSSSCRSSPSWWRWPLLCCAWLARRSARSPDRPRGLTKP